MGKFELINPILAGNIKTSFDGAKPENAAQSFWETLTSDNKLIVNELHKFMFTLKGGNDDLHHFEVKEHKQSGGNVQYEIKNVTNDVNSKVNKNELKEFLAEVNKVKSQINGTKISTQTKGGKRHRDKDMKKEMNDDDSSSDSSSDSSDDEFDFERLRRKSFSTPISYWWYSPLIYRVRKIFTPVFVQPVAPYVQLWLPMR
jgi:hypothetical protein